MASIQEKVEQLNKRAASEKKCVSSPLHYVQLGKTYPAEHPEKY